MGGSFYLMFSYFETGITDTKCAKYLGLPELRQLIVNNPNAQKIAKIRSLRKIGDSHYKSLKSQLPNITPNCILRERNLEGENLEKNLIQFSQYMFFDFDDKTNPQEYKSYFIDKYGHKASLICLSTSLGGISVLFKIKNQVTVENFEDIWYAVKNSILPDEQIDTHCKEIGRAMFISHDPDVYCNFENEIEVEFKDDSSSDNETKEEQQSKPCKKNINNLISPFSLIPIEDVLQKIIVHTIVPVTNPIVDFRPVEFVEFFIPKVIRDGTKHVTYTRMIHTIIYLNPNIEREYIFSYMFYINNRFAKPRMEKREFIRLFNMVYNGIKETGQAIVNKAIKCVHFNTQANLTKEEKIMISNLLNGFKRKNESIQKIIDAKEELKQQKQRINKKRIAKISKLSPKTVRKYYNTQLYDIDEVVKMVNDSVPTNTILVSISNL